MPSKIRLDVLFALAAVLALPARSYAQDDGGDVGGGAGEEAKPAAAEPEKPKAEEPPPEVKGNRYRITLKSGAKIEGLLPQGVLWEKRDPFGEFVETAETEKGAGLRLNYVLNMEGDIFVMKRDVADVKDLGALTDEQMLAIKETVLKARKKSLEEREKINREEMAKIGNAAKAEEAREAAGGAKGEDGKEDETAKKLSAEAKARKKGDDLLKKFPPPEWGARKIEDLNRNAVINGIFPSTEEQEFIDNIGLWKEAFARKEAAEKNGTGEGGGEGGEGGDSGEKGSGEETKKETPPAGGTDRKGPPEKIPPLIPPKKKGV